MTPQRLTLTTEEVAEEFQIHPETVRKWARDGKLRSITLPGGRLKRFRRSDILALLASADEPVNDPAEADSEAGVA